MRRIALLTAISVVLLWASQSFAQTGYLSCYDVPYSPDDVAGVLSTVARPGDTVWVPIYVQSDSIIAGFSLIIRYDSTFITPIYDPASPTEFLYQRVGRFALAPGEQDYLHLGPSYNPNDSGAIVAFWPTAVVPIAPMPIGDGPIALMAFEVSPFARQNDQALFQTFAINQILEIDDTVFPPDTTFVDCRTSEFAINVDGGSNFSVLYPSWLSGKLTVDTAYNGIPQIEYFLTDRRAVVQGDSTLLGWDVRGADSVVLQPLNKVFFRYSSVYVAPMTTTDYTLIAYGPNGTAQESLLINVTLPGENQYPGILTLSFPTVTVGDMLNYYIETIDPDGTIPLFTTTTLPNGASIQQFSDYQYQLQWEPTVADVGEYPITLYATDAVDPSLVDSLQLTIIVSSANLPPVLIGDFTAVDTIYENETYQFVVNATDPNGSIPYISAVRAGTDSLFTGMTFIDSVNGTGLLTFTPDYFQGNDHPTSYELFFFAHDAENQYLSVQSPVKQLLVFNSNSGTQTPQIQFPDGAGPYSVMEDSVLTFEVTAINSNGDLAELTSSALPTNATFTMIPGVTAPNRRQLIFAPVDQQAGSYDITFYATNNGLVDSQIVSIIVLEGNVAPWIYIPPLQLDTVVEDVELSLLVFTYDSDSTIPTINAILDGTDTLATNMSFVDSGNGAGVLTFIPNRLQGGSPIPVFYYLRFTARDAVYTNVITYSSTKAIRVYDNGATCCVGQLGDPNYDGSGYGETNVIDLTTIIGYLFKGQPIPCAEEADFDNSGQIDMTDVTMIVAYLFTQGPSLGSCP